MKPSVRNLQAISRFGVNRKVLQMLAFEAAQSKSIEDRFGVCGSMSSFSPREVGDGLASELAPIARRVVPG